MIKKLIHKALHLRHPWRDIKFDELAEIYTSMSLRSFGLGLIGIFVPFYLYSHGVSIRGVFLFILLFFLIRIPAVFIGGFIVARIGPKHTIGLSTIITIVFLSMLLTYETVGWSLGCLAAVFTFANGIFFIAYHVDFSKIKSNKHAGKELGWLYTFERFGAALGPVIGGLVATIVIPEATVILAIIALLISVIPLLMTSEPVRTNQKIKFKGFKVRDHSRDFLTLAFLNMQALVNKGFWPLFIGVFIFTEGTYAKLGGVIGLSMAISMFSAQMYGRLIDENKGLSLLKFGVVMNVVIGIARSLVTAAGGVVVVSSLDEPITLSYSMPVFKGLYEAADEVEGYRIVYFVWEELFANLAKALLVFCMLLATFHLESQVILRASFLVAGLLSVIMLNQRFTALKRYN